MIVSTVIRDNQFILKPLPIQNPQFSKAMQSPCIDACKAFSSSAIFLKDFQQQQFLSNHLGRSSVSSSPTLKYGSYPCISCNFGGKRGRPREDVKVNCRRGKVGAKGKENVWSIDNEVAKAEKEKNRTRRRRKRGGKRVRNVNKRGDRVLVSGSMLMEVETVLQMQVGNICLYLELADGLLFLVFYLGIG